MADLVSGSIQICGGIIGINYGASGMLTGAAACGLFPELCPEGLMMFGAGTLEFSGGILATANGIVNIDNALNNHNNPTLLVVLGRRLNGEQGANGGKAVETTIDLFSIVHNAYKIVTKAADVMDVIGFGNDVTDKLRDFNSKQNKNKQNSCEDKKCGRN